MTPADAPMESIPLVEGAAFPVVGQDEQVEPVRVNWPKPERVRFRGWLSPTSCSLALHVFILLLFMGVTVRSGQLPPFIDTSALDTAGTPPLAVEREFNIKPIEDVGSAPAATSIPLRRLFGEPAPTGGPVEGEALGRSAAQAALPGMPAGEGKPFEATGRLRRIGFLVEGKQAYLLFVGNEEEALTVVAGPGINLEALLNREVTLAGTLEYKFKLATQVLTVMKAGMAGSSDGMPLEGRRFERIGVLRQIPVIKGGISHLLEYDDLDAKVGGSCYVSDGGRNLDPYVNRQVSVRGRLVPAPCGPGPILVIDDIQPFEAKARFILRAQTPVEE